MNEGSGGSRCRPLFEEERTWVVEEGVTQAHLWEEANSCVSERVPVEASPKGWGKACNGKGQRSWEERSEEPHSGSGGRVDFQRHGE